MSTFSLAMWSTSNKASVMITSNTSLRMISGEPGCLRQVRMLAVGGGGSSAPPRAGAGSGHLYGPVQGIEVQANTDVLAVEVGLGGAMNTTGGDTIIWGKHGHEDHFAVILRAGGGGAAQVVHGGQGYSGI